MLNGSNPAAPMTEHDVAVAQARAFFLMDAGEALIRNGLKPRPMKGEFVPADPVYYEELATLIIQRAAECPEHAAEDIGEILKMVEDLACQQVRGTVCATPLEGYTRADLDELRRSNNRKMGLPEAA